LPPKIEALIDHPNGQPGRPTGQSGVQPVDVAPFDTFDASRWEGQPIEERRWIVHNRIPAGEPGIMSGDGGTGKTKLALQLGVAVVAELPDWIGGIVETHGPVIFFSAEEKLKEMHRRVGDILAYLNLSFRDLKGGLHFICDTDDPTLGKIENNVVQPTRSLLRLEKTAAKIKPALLWIENAADVYAGNEMDRPNVTRFVRSLLGRLTHPSDASVGLIQHPSVSGLQDGTGRSGSTGWNNSGRWRSNFTKIKSKDDEPDPGLRQYEVVKNNYGSMGEKIRLKWERGVFVPEGTASSVERAASESAVDDVFMRCLDAAVAQGRTVSDSTGRNYAPAIFENMPEGKPLKRRAFELAMARLFSARRIRVDTIGPPSKRKSQIVREQK